MYNWDDPINDALSKPDIVPEKKVSSELNKNFTDSASALSLIHISEPTRPY